MEEWGKKLRILPRISNAIFENYKPSLDIDIKKADFKTLIYIKFNEGNSMSYYSEKINLESGSFTYIADKLEKLKLIERVNKEGDRRKKVLMLTKEGYKVTEYISKEFNEFLNMKIERLNDDEKKKFFKAIELLEEVKHKFIL